MIIRSTGVKSNCLQLPDSIRAENQPVIHGLFKQGTLQQAENALAGLSRYAKQTLRA